MYVLVQTLGVRHAVCAHVHVKITLSCISVCGQGHCTVQGVSHTGQCLCKQRARECVCVCVCVCVVAVLAADPHLNGVLQEGPKHAVSQNLQAQLALRA